MKPRNNTAEPPVEISVDEENSSKRLMTAAGFHWLVDMIDGLLRASSAPEADMGWFLYLLHILMVIHMFKD